MCAKGNKQQEYKSALSLQKFAAAKKKKYDKNLKKERAAARRAKRINEYKKLKQKLIEEGKIPAKKVKKKKSAKIAKASEEGDREDASLDRAIARAGPPPDEAEDLEEDAVGSESEFSDHEDEEARPQEQGETLLSDMQRIKEQNHTEWTEREESDQSTDSEKRSKEGHVKKKKWQKPRSQLQILGDKVAKQKAKEQKERQEKARQKEQHQLHIAQHEKKRKKEREKFWKKTKSGQPVMKHRIDKILDKLENSAQ